MTRKLIGKAIDRMNIANTNDVPQLLLNNLDMMMEKLKDMKQDIIKLTEKY